MGLGERVGREKKKIKKEGERNKQRKMKERGKIRRGKGALQLHVSERKKCEKQGREKMRKK